MKRFVPIGALILTISVALYLIQFREPALRSGKPAFDLSTSQGLNAYLFEQKKLKKTKPRFDKPDQAMQEEIAIRSVIGEPFSYKGSWRFKAQRIARQTRPVLSKATEALPWIERGPGNVGGRTRAVVVHPTNADLWWVGAVGGGIWKTEDSGATWRCVTDNLPVLSVTTIDVCLSSPDILYAGTGEGFYNSDAIIGDGVFKSTDGGESWQQLSSTISNTNFRWVNRIIVNPDDPDNLLAATNSGLYRSVDGGLNWAEVFNDGNRVQQIIANPLRFNSQFIAVNISGIYKSTDGGLTWNYMSEEIQNHNRIEMAIAPGDTNIVYASPVNSSSGLLGFFRSSDAGSTWIDYGNSTNWLGGQGWYDNALIVSPLDPDIVYVGGIDIYRVNINGLNMNVSKLTHWYSGAGYPYVHADQHAFAIIQTSPTNFSIIAGNDGGIHLSDDRGSNWQELNNNYNVTQYYDADRHPSQNSFIGGTQDNGTHRSPSEPDFSSLWTRVIGGDGFDCAWHKAEPGIVFGTLYNTRLYKSTDGGYNFSGINNGLPQSSIFHTPLEINPLHPDTLYTAGDDNTFYRSTDAGASWNGFTAGYNNYSRVKIASSLSNSDIVWTGSTTIYLNVSEDGGQTFSQVPQPSGSPHSYLTGLSTHPLRDSTAFVTIGASGYGKIFRTDDLGQTWQNITNNLPDVPVHTVCVMPFNPDEIWIGTDIGLFISFDEGQSWQYSDNGIPAVAIRRLKIVAQEIVAATHGRGIWSVHRDELSMGPLLAPVLQNITVPDPNTHDLKIRFSAASAYDSVQISVGGQTVDRLYNVPAGTDTFGIYTTTPPQTIAARVRGFRQSDYRDSEQKSGTIYTATDKIDENFDDLSTTFFGDFTAASESGFDTPLLNSPHPYSDQTTYLAYLGTPVTIKPGALLSYKDVAIVEPGENGSVYGDSDFWDYVTVEASSDGDQWDIIATPYDCRYDAAWEAAYNSSSSGNSSLLRNHNIDLTTLYPLDQNVYFRFRLFADANTNGWGWAIDDVQVTNVISTLAERDILVNRFELIGNYPNPFNPQTTIVFTLDKPRQVDLEIYNVSGQTVRRLLKNQTMASGVLNQVKWDGQNGQGRHVSSGTYFYRLSTKAGTRFGKMLLVR